jgi:hypothetical protein
MGKFFTWIARLLAGLCAVLFVVSFLAALVLVNAESILFRAQTYKDALQAQNIYDRLPKLLAEQILINLTNNPCKEKGLMCLSEAPSPLRTCLEGRLGGEVVTQLWLGRTPTSPENASIESCVREFGEIPNPILPDPPIYLKYLTVQDWEVLINTLAPPAELKVISEQTLDSVFSFLEGGAGQAEVSLTPIKQSLTTNGSEAIQRVLAVQPQCTQEQLLTLGTQLLAGSADQPVKLCNPPEEFMSIVLPVAETGLQTEINHLPGAIPLIDKGLQNEYRMILETTRLIMRLSPLLPLAFLVLMTLLAVRSLPGWLKWWGLPFTITGLLTVGLALSAAPLTRLAVTSAADQKGSVYALRLAISVMDVIEAIARQVALPVMIEAGVILLIGIGLLAGAFLLKLKRS